MSDLMEPLTPPLPEAIEGVNPIQVEESNIRSAIDDVEDATLKGWAFDSHALDKPVTIEVYEGDELIVASLADRLRTDVADAGFGNGFSGFEIPIPRSLFDGLNHKFELRVLSGEAPAEVLGQVDILLPSSVAAVEQTDTYRPVQSDSVVPDAAPVPQISTEVFEDNSREELELVRSSYIEDMLSKALARIDELEDNERALYSDRDLLRHQVAALTDHVGREMRSYSAAPHRVLAGDFEGTGVKTMSVTRRRDVWLNHLSRHGITGAAFALSPHDGRSGAPAILIWGSGGIGDILYSTTIIREISLLFPGAAIIVLHENGRVTEVLRSSPYVADVLWLEGGKLQSFIRACHELDIFDLIVEIRYAVTYSLPPLSRIPLDFVRTASYRGAEWQKYVRFRWPHLNNVFAQEVMRRGMTKLDLVGWTSMLPISSESELDFFLEFTDHGEFSALAGAPYVTIHHGSDPRMSGQSGLQTKNLPIQIWTEIVKNLKSAGFAVAQLGESREELVAGIDFDLRGRTALERTAYILKHASAHIDTEGGLVHMARSVNTPSVVAFGPTPVGFFSYPQNANMGPSICGDCWWTTDQWSVACPRGLNEPECMTGHSADVLAAEAIRLAGEQERVFEIRAIRPVAAGGELGHLDAAIKQHAVPGSQGGFVLGWERTPESVQDILPIATPVMTYVLGPQYRASRTMLAHIGTVKAYSQGNFPVNSATFDWIVGTGFDAIASATISTITDLGRSLRPGGVLHVIVDAEKPGMTPSAVIAKLIETNAMRPGKRFVLKIAADLKAAIAKSTELALAYSLEIRETARSNPQKKIAPVVEKTLPAAMKSAGTADKKTPAAVKKAAPLENKKPVASATAKTPLPKLQEMAPPVPAAKTMRAKPAPKVK